jgi:VWFA-related protein
VRAGRAGRAVALLIIVAGACTLAAQSQQPIVRSGTQIVRVIVLARDRSGKPVPGLKANDFAVAEDGKPQDIAFFDAHSAVTPSAAAPGPSTTPTAPGQSTAFSNVVAVDRVRNVTVILLDRLNAAWTDQAQARDGIRKFLAQVRPDDRVALYALDGTALRVLHDFTSDTAALLQAVSGAARMTSPAAEAQNAAAEPMLGPDLRRP